MNNITFKWLKAFIEEVQIMKISNYHNEMFKREERVMASCFYNTRVIALNPKVIKRLISKHNLTDNDLVNTFFPKLLSHEYLHLVLAKVDNQAYYDLDNTWIDNILKDYGIMANYEY